MKTQTTKFHRLTTLAFVAALFCTSGCALLGGANELVILDFDSSDAAADWHTWTDQFMGGSSECEFTVDDSGVAKFSGELKLTSPFAFTLAGVDLYDVDISAYDAVAIRCKSDIPEFSFALRNEPGDSVVYGTVVNVEGTDWQTIVIPFADLTASFHGQPADDAPDFDPASIAGVRFSTGGTESTPFVVEIDWIKAVPQ